MGKGISRFGIRAGGDRLFYETGIEKEVISFKDAQTFSAKIECIVTEECLSYLEAIMKYMKESGIEIETVPKLITPPLRLKLQKEAESLNQLKKTPKLPFLS